jgi:hypothetical protein
VVTNSQVPSSCESAANAEKELMEIRSAKKRFIFLANVEVLSHLPESEASTTG